MNVSPENVKHMRTRIKQNMVSGDSMSEGADAVANNADAGIAKRLQNGTDVFYQLWNNNSEQSIFPDSILEMSNAEQKGFYLQWYKAMGGDESASALAVLSTESLRDLALAQTRKCADVMAKEVCMNLSSLREEVVDEQRSNECTTPVLLSAGALYYEYEKLVDCPEVAGVCAAAQTVISQSIEADSDAGKIIRKVLITILIAVAVIVISPFTAAAAAVIVPPGLGTIVTVIISALALVIAAISQSALIKKISQAFQNEEGYKKSRNAEKAGKKRNIMNNINNLFNDSKALIELADELQKEGDLEKSMGDRLLDIDARKIAEGINIGIRKFNETYAEAEAEAEKSGTYQGIVNSKIEEAIADKSDDEKRQILTGVLQALGKEPGERTNDELLNDVVAELDACAVMSMGYSDTLAETLETAFGEETAREIEAVSVIPESVKYIAAAAYIKLSKQLSPANAKNLNPEAIGIYTAASVKSHEVVQESSAKKIPWDKVIPVLKLIAVVAACIALAAILPQIGLIIAIDIANIVFFVSMWFVNITVLANIITAGLFILAIGGILGVIAIAEKVTAYVAPGVSELIGMLKKLASWIRENVIPRAKSAYESAKEKVDNYLSTEPVAVTEPGATQPVVEHA